MSIPTAAARPRKAPRSAAGPRASRPARRDKVAKSQGAYHHGALREALLEAAERLLDRHGIEGLTLRAASREAGVSHAAPKHHFGDISGLLTELAIVGFERFRDFLVAGLADEVTPRERLYAIGRGYVAFATSHSGLFLLMFRSERLDMARPALRAAARASFEVLTSALAPGEIARDGDELSLAQAGRLAGAWSLVHGFSMLLIDGRWKPLIGRLPPGLGAEALFEAVIGSGEPGASAPSDYAAISPKAQNAQRVRARQRGTSA
jgi:AcrR family transcriptional regulator